MGYATRPGAGASSGGGDGTIADGGVTTAKLAADAVTQAKIAENSVGLDELATAPSAGRGKVLGYDSTSGDPEYVDNGAPADGSITTAKIANNAVTRAKIANDQITPAKIAHSATDANKILGLDNAGAPGWRTAPSSTPADGSITAAKLAADAVTEAKIADDQITIAHFKHVSSEADKVLGTDSSGVAEWQDPPSTSVAAGAIDTAELADGAVEEAKIADDQITIAKLKHDATNQGKVLGLSTTGEPEWTDKSTSTGTTVADGAITTAKLADNAVQEAKIADDQITIAKLKHDATNANKVLGLDNAGAPEWQDAPAATVADGSITQAKMAADSVDSDQYVDGSIDPAHLANNAVTEAKIAADQITIAHFKHVSSEGDKILGTDSSGVAEWQDPPSGGGTLATKAEAEAGMNNAARMSPLRTAEAIAAQAITTGAKIVGNFYNTESQLSAGRLMILGGNAPNTHDSDTGGPPCARGDDSGDETSAARKLAAPYGLTIGTVPATSIGEALQVGTTEKVLGSRTGLTWAKDNIVYIERAGTGSTGSDHYQYTNRLTKAAYQVGIVLRTAVFPPGHANAGQHNNAGAHEVHWNFIGRELLYPRFAVKDETAATSVHPTQDYFLIEDGSVSGDPNRKIQARNIIADGIVDNDAIQDGTIAIGKLAAVTGQSRGKFLRFNSTTGIAEVAEVVTDIADGSLATAKLADNAVTLDKLSHAAAADYGKVVGYSSTDGTPEARDVPAISARTGTWATWNFAATSAANAVPSADATIGSDVPSGLRISTRAGHPVGEIELPTGSLGDNVNGVIFEVWRGSTFIDEIELIGDTAAVHTGAQATERASGGNAVNQIAITRDKSLLPNTIRVAVGANVTSAFAACQLRMRGLGAEGLAVQNVDPVVAVGPEWGRVNVRGGTGIAGSGPTGDAVISNDAPAGFRVSTRAGKGISEIELPTDFGDNVVGLRFECLVNGAFVDGVNVPLSPSDPTGSSSTSEHQLFTRDTTAGRVNASNQAANYLRVRWSTLAVPEYLNVVLPSNSNFFSGTGIPACVIVIKPYGTFGGGAFTDGSVSTAKIADGAVTEPKLAAGAVALTKIKPVTGDDRGKILGFNSTSGAAEAVSVSGGGRYLVFFGDGQDDEGRGVLQNKARTFGEHMRLTWKASGPHRTLRGTNPGFEVMETTPTGADLMGQGASREQIPDTANPGSLINGIAPRSFIKVPAGMHLLSFGMQTAGDFDSDHQMFIISVNSATADSVVVSRSLTYGDYPDAGSDDWPFPTDIPTTARIASAVYVAPFFFEVPAGEERFLTFLRSDIDNDDEADCSYYFVAQGF